MSAAAERIGRRWRAWLSIVAVVAAAIATAVAPAPPGLAAAGGGARFPALAAAALVAVPVVLASFWRGERRRRAWLAIAVIALGAGAASYVVSTRAQQTCTARYNGAAVIIGTELTTLGAAYATRNPALSTDELLFDSAGVADRFWTRASIDRCRTFIAGTYFLWIPLLVLSLLSAAQGIGTTGWPAAAARQAEALGAPPPAGAASAPREILYDAFISYRHGGRDRELAEQVLASLESEGYRVAFDERDFPANEHFLEEMERCIRQSRFTVAIISSRYLESGNCQEEAIICKVLDMGERKRRLIPIFVDAVAAPAWMYGIVGIDATRTDAVVEPLEKLLSTLGPPIRRHRQEAPLPPS